MTTAARPSAARAAPSSPSSPSSHGAPAVEVPAWAEALVRVLDRAFVIPGTNIPIGLDAILGFIAPGAGDAASALATASLVWLAFKMRVPKPILLRMLLNIAIDALIGVVPFLGDLYDVFYRAADKNLALIRKHGGASGAPPDAGDYAILSLALLCILGLLVLPIVVGLAIMHLVVRISSG